MKHSWLWNLSLFIQLVGSNKSSTEKSWKFNIGRVGTTGASVSMRFALGLVTILLITGVLLETKAHIRLLSSSLVSDLSTFLV